MLAKSRAQYRANRIAFPARGSAEYRLLQEQAIDFLVQQSLAHQVDAKLGIKPEDRVVTDASWRKVVSGVHVDDAQIRAVFAKDPKRYKRGPSTTLDLGTATEIRMQLLTKERAAAMHKFVADAEKRWPVTYAAAYRPVSEMGLARKVWAPADQQTCRLPAGNYSYSRARAHGCVSTVAVPGSGSPACSMIGPERSGGFSGAEMNDGYAEYVMDNAGTCSPDPRLQPVQVTPQQSIAPAPRVRAVKVSYLRAAGTGTYKDALTGLTLRYPRRLHVSQTAYGSVESVEGVVVANYKIDPTAPNPPLSRNAVDVQLTQAFSRLPGPQYVPGTKLPIRLTDADIARGMYTTQVSGEGETFNLTIRTGGAPSREDVAALKAIVASIHFAPLRIGHLTPGRLYVLGRVTAYPLGSVTEIPASPKLKSGRSYLEHTADGFWLVTWPDNLLHGYKACGPHWNAAKHEFTCPSGAVWNLEGQVVKNPDPARFQDDSLERSQVVVADGDVLVSLPPPP